MNYLLDPNIAYFLLVGGIILAILALFTPGTGLIEIGALFVLALAGYGIINLPMNIWALGVLLISSIGLAAALWFNRGIKFMVLAVAGFVLGSIFIFRLPNGNPAVNPIFAVLVSAGSVGFIWVIGFKGLEAVRKKPAYRVENVVNKTGKALTDILQEGTVYVGGEQWSARSEKLVHAGSHVKVAGREGLILLVEAVNG